MDLRTPKTYPLNGFGLSTPSSFDLIRTPKTYLARALGHFIFSLIGLKRILYIFSKALKARWGPFEGLWNIGLNP